MNWSQFLSEKPRLFKANYSRAPLYARLVTHRLTPFVVYFFAERKVTPDQVTLLSLIVGWTSSLFLAAPSSMSMLLGAFFLEIYYVLDSVDGQLARLTGQCSKTGAFLDILLNYLVHPFCFLSIGVGQCRVTGNWVWVLLGAIAALSYVWLGLMWHVRAHVLVESLKENEGSSERKRDWARWFFSLLHKLCTFPTVMNLITVTAIVQALTQRPDLFGYVLIFHSLALPLVSLSKVAHWTLTREMDEA